MPDSRETGPHSSGAHDTVSDVAPVQRSLQLERGSLVGRYVVVEPIGAGGMSIVYLAYDPELDRRVALKVVRAAADASSKLHERERMRLLREAQAMARLTHPNVMPIYDAGSIGERVFLAMHYVEGQTLTQWLAQGRGWRQIVEFFVYAGRGLAAAHAAGLVHRDFKPDNVLVDREGRVRVTDFGLARPSEGPRSIDESDGEQRPTPTTSSTRLEKPVTLAGAVLGTPAYMSPEQHLAAEVDARTDQFSFCVALWEALAGERPFSGGSVGELAFAVTRGKMRAFPRETQVPTRVRKALLRGLALKPEDRFPSMGELLEALQPRIRTKPLLFVAGAVALVGAGSMLTLLAEDRDAAADPCAVARSGLDESYDEEARETTIDAVRATRGLAIAATDRVAAVLDARAEEWREAAISACVAYRVEGTESAQAFDARMRCLARRRAEFESLLTTLQHSDSQQIVTVASDLFDAVSPSECNDASRLLEDSPPPDDPALRTLADSVDRRLIDLSGTLTADDDTVTAFQQLERDAASTGWKPLLARVLGAKAHVHAQRGEVAQSEADLRAAARSAAEGRDDSMMLAALGDLAYTLAHLQGRVPEALEVAYLLEIGLERFADNPRTPSVFNSLGAVYQAAQQNGRARDAYAKGLALIDLPGHENPIRRASLLNNLGTIALAEGHSLEARRSFEEALAIGIATFGADDARLSDYHLNLCLSYLMRGELAEAMPSCERALELVDGPEVRDAAAESRALMMLANLDTSVGDFARAAKWIARARPLVATTFGENSATSAILDGIDAIAHFHQGKIDDARRLALASDQRLAAAGPAAAPLRASMLAVRGMIADASGDHSTALELCETAAASQPADLAILHPSRIEPLVCLGDARLHLGKHEEAKAAYLQIGTIQRSMGGDPYLCARARFGLAKIADAAGDRAAAREDARAAQRLVKSVARRSPPFVAEIDAWLEAHP